MSTVNGLFMPTLLMAAWLFIPGLLIGAAARFRGLAWWALAPLLSTVTASCAAIIAPHLGMNWGPLAMICGTAFGIVIIGLCRWASGPTVFTPLKRRELTLVVFGLTVGAATLGVAVVSSLPHADAASQTYDGIFHFNAVEMIIGRADASSLHMDVTNPQRGMFYPAAFHALASLVPLTMASVTSAIAVNALTVVICALVWPATIALLTQQLTENTLAAVVTAAIAGIAPQFPLLFIEFGTLYPNLLSYALLPAVVALTWRVLASPPRRDMLLVLPLLLAGIVALTLAQPNGVFSALIAVGPLGLIGFWRQIGVIGAVQNWSRPLTFGLRSVSWAVIISCYLLLHIFTWYGSNRLAAMRHARPHWPEEGSLSEALVRIPTLTVGHYIGSTTVTAGVVFAVLSVAALAIALWIRHYRPVALVFITVEAVAIVNFCLPQPYRTAVFGWWYADPQRIHALLPLAVVPLLAVGLTYGLEKVRILPLRYVTTVVVSAVIAGGAYLLPANQWVRQGIVDTFALPEKASTNILMLSQQEKRLFERLRHTLPADALLIGDPWNGSPYAWAFSGHRTIFPQPGIIYPPDAPETVLAGRLNQVSTDPSVCKAVDKSGARYVLSLGRLFEFSPGSGTFQADYFSGLTNIDSAPGFKLIDREGEARLYEITACQPGH